MQDDRNDPIYAPADEAGRFRQAMWDIASAVVDHFYEHPDVKYPPAVAAALAELDAIPDHPLRPLPPEADALEDRRDG